MSSITLIVFFETGALTDLGAHQLVRAVGSDEL